MAAIGDVAAAQGVWLAGHQDALLDNYIMDDGTAQGAWLAGHQDALLDNYIMDNDVPAAPPEPPAAHIDSTISNDKAVRGLQ